MTLGVLSDGINELCTPNTAPVPAALDNVLADTLRTTPHRPDILLPTPHSTPPSSLFDLTWGETRRQLVLGLGLRLGGRKLTKAEMSRQKCCHSMGLAHTDCLGLSTQVIKS